MQRVKYEEEKKNLYIKKKTTTCTRFRGALATRPSVYALGKKPGEGAPCGFFVFWVHFFLFSVFFSLFWCVVFFIHWFFGGTGLFNAPVLLYDPWGELKKLGENSS